VLGVRESLEHSISLPVKGFMTKLLMIPLLCLVGCADTNSPQPQLRASSPPPIKQMPKDPTWFTNEQNRAIHLAKDKFPELGAIIASPPESQVGEPETDIFVQAENGGWNITFVKGWGDCPSGCINHHYWFVFVDRNENVTLKSEVINGTEPEPSRP
jgi:hypothetical protein